MKRRALSLLLAAAASAGASALAQQAPSPAPLSVSFPHKSWAFQINSPGFAVETEGAKSDGREYLLANNSKTGMVLSVTLEKSPGRADPKSCPDYLRTRMKSVASLDPKDVKTSQVGGMSVVEYIIPGPNGMQLEQKNFVACTAKEDVYLDIHLSKVKFQPSDERSFIEVLKQTQFADLATAAAPSAPAGTTTMDLFREGSKRFQMQDFSGAIAPYQQALDRERAKRQLSKTLWYVLVDNLGMAYGISGDLDHAEETFQYGVSQDSDYPIFYYNLACTYAGRNNKEKTMDYLKMAFARKANVIPGEEMPDPGKDDSFRDFMKDPEFSKLAASLYLPN